MIFHHLFTYLSDAYPSLLVFEHAGFLAVGGFFMISGYGLQYSATHRENYLRGFFRKRLVSILVPYYIINLFYLAIRYISDSLTLEYAVLSVFGVNLWYVTAICVLYIGFWLSHRIFGKRGGKYAATAFTALYVVVCLVWNRVFGNAILGFWWYNSVICFVAGMWYCDAKDAIDRALKKAYAPVLVFAVAIFAATYGAAALAPDPTALYVLVLQIVCAAVFSLLVIMLSMKLRIGNTFINLCGDLSLELYLTHAIMIALFRSGVSVGPFTLHLGSPDYYLTAILVGTFAMSVCVHWAVGKLLRRG